MAMFLDNHREETAEISDDSSSDVEASSTEQPTKGLSKYYKGKSQSFTSISEVESVEDLAKKRYGSMKLLKSRRSYGGGLDDVNHVTQVESPRAVANKGPRGSCGSLVGRVSKPPRLPMQKNF